MDNDLEILYGIEYYIEKDFFLEKIGSGDRYRSHVKRGSIVEKYDSKNDRHYFRLDVNHPEGHVKNKKLHKKFVEYYEHKTKNYFDDNSDFDRYVYRFVNLMGHYISLNMENNALELLDKIGPTLYKKGYKDLLRKVLNDFTRRNDMIISLIYLYMFEEHEYAKLDDDVIMQVAELYPLLNKIENNEFTSENLLACFNAPSEIERLLYQVYFTFIKKPQQIDDISLKEFYHNDGRAYYLSLYGSLNDTDLLILEPSFENMCLLKRKLELVYIQNDYNNFYGIFIELQALMVNMGYDVTSLYIKLMVVLVRQSNTDDIINVCQIMLQQKCITRFKLQKTFFDSIIEYENGQNSDGQFKTSSNFKLIFERYKMSRGKIR